MLNNINSECWNHFSFYMCNVKQLVNTKNFDY